MLPTDLAALPSTIFRVCSTFRTKILAPAVVMEYKQECGVHADGAFPFHIQNKQLEGANMDVSKILADLRQERDQLEEAILSLERLARGRGKRRGRPPAWMTVAKKRGRPPGSKNKTQPVAKASAAS